MPTWVSQQPNNPFSKPSRTKEKLSSTKSQKFYTSKTDENFLENIKQSTIDESFDANFQNETTKTRLTV